MSLSPWDLGGISFDFNVYRPRRPSYLIATQRRRSLRDRVGRSEGDSVSTSSEIGADFFDSSGTFKQQKRKNSYRRATRNSNSDIELDAMSETRNATPQMLSPNSPKLEGAFFEETPLPPPPPPPPPTRVSSIPSAPAPKPPNQNKRSSSLRNKNTPRMGSTDIRIEVTPPVNHLTSPTHSPPLPAPLTSEIDQSVLDAFQKVIDEHVTITRRKEGERGDEEGGQSSSEENDDLYLFKSNWVYKRNLIVICLSFIFVFSAFRAIQNLESSLNSKGSLGTITMACVHGGMVATCLFTPVVINKITAKWAIVLGILCHLTWAVANIFPHFATLIPTSILLGFGQNLAWSGQVTYISKLAVDYAHSLKEISDQEIYRFNGIFLGCFQTTHIWGNLVSSLLLDTNDAYEKQKTGVNGTGSVSLNYEHCGIFDTCDNLAGAIWNVAKSEVRWAESTVITLMVTFASFTFVGLTLVVFFLSKISARMDHQNSLKEVVHQSFTHMFHHRTFRLLIPLLIFNGFEQGFVYADFTKSFISCKLGAKYIGFCMITLGIANCGSSIFVAILAKKIQREVIIGVGGIVHIALMVLLIMWMPSGEEVPVFFIVAAFWGVCDAVWQTQCNTLIAISCPNEHEVAFANFRLLQGFGASMAFGLGAVACASVKLYIIMSLLTFAIMCYVLAEYNMRQEGPTDVLVNPQNEASTSSRSTAISTTTAVKAPT